MESYNKSIDSLKGILILLVIIGHILLGTLNENLFRFLIYSFHMPLFFFISGYLFNWRKIKQMKVKVFINKYFHRMIIPWSLAWCVYTILILNKNISLYNIAHNIAYPYYHLWFIPSLFGMCTTLYILMRFFKIKQVMYIATCIGVCVYITKEFLDINLPIFINIHFFIFFLFGVFQKGNGINIKINQGWSILFILFFIVSLFYHMAGNPETDYRKYLLPFINLLLCTAITPFLKLDFIFKSPTLVFCGKHSLEIYLWHVLPIMVLKYIFPDNKSAYYLTSFAILLLFIFYIKYRSRKIATQEYV